MLRAENLKKYYPVQKSALEAFLTRRRQFVKAVDGVSFEIGRGEVLALVGESGCGKSTTGRMLTLLEKPTSGRIYFDGVDITELEKDEERNVRRRIQMVFQDPYASLNPRMKVGEHIVDALEIHGIAEGEEAKSVACDILDRVGLPAENFFDRYPYQLSGGQRQRVVIARAMVLKPEFVVADEPVSMIDVSLRAAILDLLMSFRDEYDLSMLFITHDLSVARLVGDRIAVMYLGKIVEIGETRDVLHSPKHPYTAALLSAVPSFVKKKVRVDIIGDVADPKNVPSGCRYHPRCPFARKECREREPELVGEKHAFACHHPLDISF